MCCQKMSLEHFRPSLFASINCIESPQFFSHFLDILHLTLAILQFSIHFYCYSYLVVV